MLLEWLTYLTTPCPRHLREMGYLREQIGIASRLRRCREAWEPHLGNCRELIVEAAEACTRRQKAVVLGSGLAHDVPLAWLAAHFAEVVLIDILHPKATRRRARAHSNVRFVERDLTGVVEAVHAAARDGTPLPRPASGLPEDDADLVVSANILSQRPLLIGEYLERKAAELSEDEIEGFLRAMVERHLAALARFRGVACLITEIERLFSDGGVAIRREDPLHGVKIPFPGWEWSWEIAPRPEMGPDFDVTYRVLGAVVLEPARRKITRTAP